MTAFSARRTALVVLELCLALSAARGLTLPGRELLAQEQPTPSASASPSHTVAPTLPTLPLPTATPTATALPTATPTRWPALLPLIYRQTRLLANGDFEAGAFAPGWSASGVLGRSVAEVERHTGRYAALLGSPAYDNRGDCPVGEAVIAQVVDVAASGQPQLRFWYRIYSYDTLDFDYFAVTITSSATGETRRVWFDGRIQWDPHLWSSGWQEAAIPLDRYRGQTVTLRFFNAMTNEDGWYNTWTFVDDITLTNRVQ